MMKICTVNLPEPFIAAMERIISEYGLYPSRSELIRVALREFIIKELNVLNRFEEYQDPNKAGPEGLPQSFPKTLDMRTVRSNNFGTIHKGDSIQKAVQPLRDIYHLHGEVSPK